MSAQSKKTEQEIEAGLRQWHDENLAAIADLQKRADALAEQRAGRDPANIVDGHFVEQPDNSIEQQQKLSHIEGKLDAGANVTQEDYNTLRKIELENEKKWRHK